MPAKKPPTVVSDLTRLRAMRDEDIDYSDSPALDEAFLAQPPIAWPPPKEAVTIRLDADLVGWFKRGGRGYQTRINRALRTYVEANERMTRAQRQRVSATATRSRSRARSAARKARSS